MNSLYPSLNLLSRTFFEPFSFFCQGEWIRLATYLILYGLIIPSFLSLVKKKFLSFSFFFGMDFSLASLCLFHNCALYMHVHFIIIKRDIEFTFYIPFNTLIQTYNSMDPMHHLYVSYLLALQAKTIFQ